MITGPLASEIVQPADRVVILVGNYGSGKTEVAVNLAISLADSGRRVQIADLDIVNPYFRCREAREEMQRHAIRVVVPPGAQAWADLPIVLPEIAGMLAPPPGTHTIFDVGGDDVGARVLASLRTRVSDGGYQLWQVINSRRPFTDSVDACERMRDEIERSSRMAVTGLVVNAHLIDDTSVDVVLEGWVLARGVAERTGLPIRCVAVMEPFAAAPELRVVDAPLLRMRRRMLPPWLSAARETTGGRSRTTDPLPEEHRGPIGVPRRIRLGEPEGDSHGQDRD